MDETTRKKEPKYCHSCGRRLNQEAAQCWYCGAMARQTVRPPRRCVYCGEAMRPEAIKCPHCGEFQDGRPQARQAVPSQVVFVVDRELLQAAQDQRLLAGQAVPPEIASVLAPETVRAIESNQPRMITQEGVKAIAPPAGETTIDGGTQAPVGEATGTVLQSRPPASSSLPTRPEDTPKALALRLGLTLGHALGMLARYIWRSVAGKTEAGHDTVDAEAEPIYKVCEACGEEIRTSDNFCCYCGYQHHALSTDKKKAHHVHHSPTGGIYLLVVLLNAAVFARLYFPIAAPAYLNHVLAGLAALFCVLGFMRRRRFLSQVMAVLLLLATVVIYLKVVILD